MPAEHVPEVGVFQVMHMHIVASCSKHFLRFRVRSKLTGEGLATTFSN